jgi:phosphoserine phosphatase
LNFRFTGAGHYQMERIREQVSALGCGWTAGSDSVTNLRLLEVAGRPRLVNPDGGLSKVANLRGWPQRAVSQAGSSAKAGCM